MTESIQTQQSTDIAPAHQLLPMMLGVAQAQLLRVAAELGIADLLKDGPKLLEELAEVTDTQAAALLRIMRALINLGIFAETETGKFICTPLGELLQTDHPNSLRNYAILMSSDWLYQVWSNLLHSVQTGESAFEDVFGMNLYAYFQEHPNAGAVLSNAMTDISKQEGVALRDAYDFSAFQTIVDVGGGRGLLLATLLRGMPSLKGILLDLPSVVEGAQVMFETNDLHDRCQIIGGNFLSAVPSGGDVYILKRILMDHPDEQARTILTNIRDVMAADSRVLVVDPDIRSLYGNLVDILMLVVFGSRLRTEAELRDLFASTGFKLTRSMDTQSMLRLFEAVRA